MAGFQPGFAGVFNAFSAGIQAADRISPGAVQVMKELYGVDMEKTTKSLAALSPIDILVTMGCNVACSNVPAKHREDWGLEDLKEKPKEEFLRTAKLIEVKTKDLMQRVQERASKI